MLLFIKMGQLLLNSSDLSRNIWLRNELAKQSFKIIIVCASVRQTLKMQNVLVGSKGKIVLFIHQPPVGLHPTTDVVTGAF